MFSLSARNGADCHIAVDFVSDATSDVKAVFQKFPGLRRFLEPFAPVVWTSEKAIGDFCPASPVPRAGDPLPAPGQAEPGPAPRREPRVSRRHSFGRRFAVDCVVAAQSHETTTKRFDV